MNDLAYLFISQFLMGGVIGICILTGVYEKYEKRKSGTDQ